MPRLKELIHEVHRRSLWQVLGIYVVGAWIGYEVIQGLTEGMGLPSWFPSLAVVLFIIGLPIVLATAFVQEGVTDRAPTSGAGELETTAGGTPIPAETRHDAARQSGSGARRVFTWRNALIGGVVAVALWGVVATAWLLFLARSDGESTASDAPLDAQVVAVLPFRISGADASLAYLREGMVDLLAAKLTGQGGPRAADPRSVLSAWRGKVGSDDEDLPQESSLQVARSLGAGRVMLGGVVGTPDRVTLNASLVDVATGESVAADVSGPAADLPDLVDDLTARVLALEAGEASQRLGALADTPLEALRAYLEGQAAYRGGRYGEAEEAYRRAIAVDSTFALAHLGVLASVYWTRGGIATSEEVEPAIALRDLLGPRDQALLDVLTTNYPRQTSFAGQLTNTRRAVEIAPDSPDFWYWLGEVYFHGGAMLGIEDPFASAEQAFQRAVELDAEFSAPLAHLVDVAVIGGDTAEIRRQAARFFAVDSLGEIADYERWNVAHGLGDTTALRAVEDRFPTMSAVALRAIIRQSQLRGVGSDDVDRAAAVLNERTEVPSARFSTLLLLSDYEWNRGRLSVARALRGEVQQLAPLPDVALSAPLFAALYDNGDRAEAEQALSILAPRAGGPGDTSGIAYPGHGVSICVTELWRLEQGITDTAERAIARLRAADLDRVGAVEYESALVCAITLEAKLAAVRGDAGAGEALARLDSIIGEAPLPYAPVGAAAVHTAARLYEERGDLEDALRRMRARSFYWTTFLASQIREEGRLAALTGDRDGAVRAYRHYLALRSDPEPSIAAEVESVRAELARLEAE